MLAITTSAPLASTWLVPRLRSFIALHPQIDVRCIAADSKLDLARERLDIAIRWAALGSAVPGGETLFNVDTFPVCAPALARSRARPLRSPADLVRHVLLDLDTITGAGPWSDWSPWLEAMKLRDLKPAGVLRFSHYDQVVQAAMDGSGVAIGRTPHIGRHLRDGLLVAPLGDAARCTFGVYSAIIAPRSAERQVVKDFVGWLHEEIREDAGAQGERAASAKRRARPHRSLSTGPRAASRTSR